MYDSVDPWAIPLQAPVVAGYTDGIYVWPQAGWDRFPSADKVAISCLGTNSGLVLDIEAGCCQPGQAPAWIQQRQAAGVARPVVYVNRSNWAAVTYVCQGLEYDVWLADYTCQPHLASGTVATQYANPACGSGGNYDLSLVADGWPAGGPMLLDQPQSDELLNASNTGSASHNILRDGVNPGEASYLKVLKDSQDQILAAVQGLAPGGFTAADRTQLNQIATAVASMQQQLSGLVPQIAAIKTKTDRDLA